MKTKVTIGKAGPETAHPAAQRRRASGAGAVSGAIAQLAGKINSSPRVQSLAQLRLEIHERPHVQGRMGRGSSAGVAGPAQAKPKEEKVQTKPKEEKIQAKPREKKIQTKPKEDLRQRQAAKGQSGAPRGPGPANSSELPQGLKRGVESLSGMSMDHVRVHRDSSEPAQLNALAYARGSEIHMGPGQEQHLAHEAWHVVQQAQGRVQPTKQLKTGVSINDDSALEREADTMGRKAMMSTGQMGEEQVKPAPGIEAVQLVRDPPKKKKAVKTPNSTEIANELDEYESTYGKIPGNATLRRWATESEKEQIKQKNGTYNGVEHKGSTQNAVWFTFENKKSLSVMDGRNCVLEIDLDIPRDKLVNFSKVTSGGESNFPNHILYKENERGALGIGRNLIKGKKLAVKEE